MCRDSCCVFMFRTLEEWLSPSCRSGEAAGRPRGSETDRQPKSWCRCEEMFEVQFAKMMDWMLLPPHTETHDPEASWVEETPKYSKHAALWPNQNFVFYLFRKDMQFTINGKRSRTSQFQFKKKKKRSEGHAGNSSLLFTCFHTKQSA